MKSKALLTAGLCTLAVGSPSSAFGRRQHMQLPEPG